MPDIQKMDTGLQGLVGLGGLNTAPLTVLKDVQGVLKPVNLRNLDP